VLCCSIICDAIELACYSSVVLCSNRDDFVLHDVFSLFFLVNCFCFQCTFYNVELEIGFIGLIKQKPG
jgi:hypothetical protein